MHLPAFFTAALGPFTGTEFVTFMLTAIAATFLYTWVFNTTRGSILLAMLLHAASNAASSLMNRLVPEELLAEPWRTMLYDGWLGAIAFGLVALLIIAGTRGRLAYTPERPATATGDARPTVAPTTTG